MLFRKITGREIWRNSMEVEAHVLQAAYPNLIPGTTISQDVVLEALGTTGNPLHPRSQASDHVQALNWH